MAVVRAKEALGSGEAEIAARLGKDGSMSLTVGGREAASGKAGGPISQMPIDGLEVGRDENGAVGNYETPNKFTGEIGKVVISLE